MIPKSRENGVSIFGVLGFWEGPDADCPPVAPQVAPSWVGMRSEVVLGGCFWPSEGHSGTSGQGNL